MEKARESANCPYCLSPIQVNEDKVRCPVCGVDHHTECWRMNGKCSVYGCDGWQAWSGEIADKIAPKIRGSIDIDKSGTERTTVGAQTGPLCMECGEPVKHGQLVCRRCRKIGRPRYLENCMGPSVIMLGVFVGIVSLLVKGLS